MLLHDLIPFAYVKGEMSVFFMITWSKVECGTVVNLKQSNIKVAAETQKTKTCLAVFSPLTPPPPPLPPPDKKVTSLTRNVIVT